jgi:hypothetical protein
VKWADYDNDGDLDFVIAGYGSTTSVGAYQLWLNNGDGTFTEDTRSALQTGNFISLTWGDYNNDGAVDLLESGYGSDWFNKVFKNSGTGTFSEVASLPGTGNGESRWIDYDSDGDLDVVQNGQVNSGMWRNNGDDTFTLDAAVSVLGDVYGTLRLAISTRMATWIFSPRATGPRSTTGTMGTARLPLRSSSTRT